MFSFLNYFVILYVLSYICKSYSFGYRVLFFIHIIKHGRTLIELLHTFKLEILYISGKLLNAKKERNRK